MRPHAAVLLIALAAMPRGAGAQHTVGRPMAAEPRHQLVATVGLDNGSRYGLAYERHGLRLLVPVALGATVRMPFGHEQFDDYEVSLGARVEALQTGRFVLGVGYRLQVRRNESTLSRLYALGNGVEVAFGASGRRWSGGALASYDWASLAHIRHKLAREYYPEIRDGWYDVDGGSFRFGAAAGFQARSWGFSLVAGRIFGRNFGDNPMLPYFLELSLRKGL